MAIKRIKRVGRVTIAVNPRDNQYVLEWLDKSEGKGRRRTRFTGVYVNSRRGIPTGVTEAAELLYQEMLEGQVRTADVSGTNAHLYLRTGEAIDAALVEADPCAGHLKNHQKQKTYFMDWLESEFGERDPLFSEIRRATLLEYKSYLKAKGISDKTVKNYLSTVLLANRHHYLSSEGAFPLIIAVTKKTKNAEPRRVLEKKKKYLTWDELVNVLEFMRNRSQYRYVEDGFILGGFVGLNLFELSGIQKQDHDYAAGTLTIPGTKNESRIRTIPLPVAVNEWCRVRFAQLPESESHLVTLTDGSPITKYTTIANAVYRFLLKPANDAGICKKISAHELRKSAINLAREADTVEEDRKPYFGHAVTSVHGKVYSDNEETEHLRRRIVKPMEKKFPQLTNKSFLLTK